MELELHWFFFGVKWRQVMVPSSDLSCSSSLLGSALENYGKVLADHMEKYKNAENHNELLFCSETLSYFSKKEF